MPVTCLVFGCNSRYKKKKDREKDHVKFYRVPAALSFTFLTDKNELSQKRRALWIAALKRSDLTQSKLSNQKVCSKHFITGKPAALDDENNPDWVPSLEMELTAQKMHRQPDDLKKKERLGRKRKVRVSPHAEQTHHTPYLPIKVDLDSEIEN